MSRTTKLFVSLLLVIVVALSFAGGFTFGKTRGYATDGKGLDIVGQVWQIILTDYVDKTRINTDNMSQSAIEGIIAALDDPYTSYLEADLYKLGISTLQGEFNGIGAMVSIKDNQLTIVAPIADSPADKAGIRAGDIILEINGEPVINMSLPEAILKIRGPQGTSVKLLILHQDKTEPELIEVTRTRLELPSVLFEMKGDIAYINISQFSERTNDEISTALQGLTGAKATGIIIDLRGNPGGLLDSVVDVASHFLHDGTILDVVSNQGKVETIRVKTSSLTTDLPMVVLVDGGSASGSEVLSGALQDHKRALIAGTTTYGKGSVNILRELSDGSGLYVTTARWLTPDGRRIEGQGIEPDQKLELTGDDAIEWAINYLKGAR